MVPTGAHAQPAWHITRERYTQLLPATLLRGLSSGIVMNKNLENKLKVKLFTISS
ncbi:hypothetical protein OIDMADRAFT_21146 [Oidiodendron maius Zn]|uniref:Uncharacterized protein n=1 Tax=Oidiodendron maius (strain Zn) TaxID=913774 RepID=A0A0C3GYX9_OIDMZ|nr:hypothetical protein OIDMADRAFT_21146 [Oidiodendron maius Zn]